MEPIRRPMVRAVLRRELQETPGSERPMGSPSGLQPCFVGRAGLRTGVIARFGHCCHNARRNQFAVDWFRRYCVHRCSYQTWWIIPCHPCNSFCAVFTRIRHVDLSHAGHAPHNAPPDWSGAVCPKALPSISAQWCRQEQKRQQLSHRPASMGQPGRHRWRPLAIPQRHPFAPCVVSRDLVNWSC